MTQIRLINAPTPPGLPPGIDLRCCDVVDLLTSLDETPALVIADPPWTYNQAPPRLPGDQPMNASEHYDGLPVSVIRDHFALIPKGCPRLALWATWPVFLPEWDLKLKRWGRPITGGAWFKSDPNDEGHYGPGFHWSGCSEPVLIYTKGTAYCDRSSPLRNAWHEAPGKHSRKPVGWMRQWVRRWTKPGDLVLDMYAGLGSVAEVCLLEERRYIGAELDPARHRDALGLLAQVRL